uniref:ribosomal protein S18 n=1 Tax=Prosopanche panguanensis TaxID=2952649 RepID=UPI002114B004|nr:ribosomal protein S18 [Prosopanche panguanensis]USN93702.1 ribosomal protein S18 [Prosopanche panguanensis]
MKIKIINKKIIKKLTFFKKLNINKLNYKDIKILYKFLSIKGKILSRKVTKLNFKKQKSITIAIKRARILSLLPFNKSIDLIKNKRCKKKVKI